VADLAQLIKHFEMTSGGADGDEVGGALVSRQLLVPRTGPRGEINDVDYSAKIYID
jgi:hypothetical protein